MVVPTLLRLGLLLAQPPTGPNVAFEAPASCPVRAEFVAALEGYVGRALTEDIRVRVRVTPDHSYALALEFVADGATVSETLVDPNCSVVLDAAAVRVGLAIDPDATSRALAQSEPEPEPRPLPLPPPDLHPEPDFQPEPDLQPSPAVRRQPNVGRAPEAEPELQSPAPVDCSPRLGPGAGGRAAALCTRLLDLGLAQYVRRYASADAGASGEVRLTQLDVAARGRLGLGPFEFPLCAGLEVGSVYARA